MNVGYVINSCEIIGYDLPDNGTVFKLVCSCGKQFSRKATKLRYAEKNLIKVSCGCLVGKSGTHLNTNHPLYARYKAMLARCNNPKNVSYKDYGARGIKVCKEWTNSFETFLSDMGECPEGYEIDRENVNGNYCKDNCRWVNRNVQAFNKRVKNNPFNVAGIRLSDNGLKYVVKLGVEYLGTFNNLFDAICARKSAENKKIK